MKCMTAGGREEGNENITKIEERRQWVDASKKINENKRKRTLRKWVRVSEMGKRKRKLREERKGEGKQ